MKKKPQYLEKGKALKGHDPLSVYDGIATMGDENITSVYEDAIYQFITSENKVIFDKTPGKYSPKYGGYCSIAISEGSLVEANSHSALIQDGDLHVFYKDDDEDTQDEWNENPVENKKRAEIEWAKLI
ncbi:MAG: YHS domain-containing (seleno)protein [Psychroserpens sp.]|uniref:YHS domain-containing (seleno)protein n=1 Tax=Psychroserpens sp. TaxID=2020870 RepID=UPI0030014C72